MSTTLPKIEEYRLVRAEPAEHEVAADQLLARVQALLQDEKIRRFIIVAVEREPVPEQAAAPKAEYVFHSRPDM